MKKNRMIENCVYEVPLVLSGELEAQRESLKLAFANSQKRLRDFAVRNGWERFVEENFIDRAEIYHKQEELVNRILGMAGADSAVMLPKEFSACLEDKIFMSVSPELYSRIYPEAAGDTAFEKLIVHEMAHRLHVRILGGNEEAMGPIWFFEGFAVHAADQFPEQAMPREKIWKIARNPERGSYRKYSSVFRHFLKYASIHELISHAGDKNFLEWLEGRERGK